MFVPGDAPLVHYIDFLDTWVYSVWRVNKKVACSFSGRPPVGVLYRVLGGRDLGVFRVEVNKKGRLFVPRDAPLVY